MKYKLFESEDLNAFERFAKTGASANAYTSFEKTAYLFKGSENIGQSLEILLDFVRHPYFTEENVESEKGIITQEINMCDDNPTDVLYEYIRKNSFHNNPFKDSVIGTIKDINDINKITDIIVSFMLLFLSQKR